MSVITDIVKLSRKEVFSESHTK
jgi:hypothetical protein